MKLSEFTGWFPSLSPIYRLNDIKHAPFSPAGQTIVIATGAADTRVGNEGGIWRSINGGRSWHKPTTSNPSNPGCSALSAGAYGIAFDAIGSTIYVGTDCGLAISRDWGATWTHTNLNAMRPAVFSVATFRGGIVHVVGPAGHQWSRDYALTFSGITPGSPLCESSRGVAVSPVESSTIYVAAPTGLFEGNFRADLSIAWTRVSPPLDTSRTGRENWVATTRSRNGNVNYFDIYFSDGFATWRQTCRNSGPLPRCSDNPTAWERLTLVPNHDDHNGIAFNPVSGCPAYLMTDGGVYVPSDTGNPLSCGGSWQISGNGLNGFSALQIYDVTGSLSPLSTTLFFGTQDNTLFSSTDGGLNWPHGQGDEGWHVQMQRRRTLLPTLFTWGEWSGNYFHYDRFPGGPVGSWQNPPGGAIDTPTIVAPGVFLQLGVANGTRSLYVSRNATGTNNNWRLVSEAPFLFERRPWLQSSKLAGDVFVYVPFDRMDRTVGLYRIRGIRSDGSLSPFGTRREMADNGLGNIGVNGDQFVWPAVFAVDPHEPNHLLAADVSTGEMKVSRTGGGSWQSDPILTELVQGVTISGRTNFVFRTLNGRSQARAIAFDPLYRGHILVGTEAAGIFRSIDGGRSWATIPGSDRIPSVTSFFFVENTSRNPNDEVVVSSFGRGLWKLSLPPGSYGANNPFRVPPSVWGQWVRNPIDGLIAVDIANIPNSCHSCRWFVLVGGFLSGIHLNENKEVTALAIDNGRVVASSNEGQPLAHDLQVIKTNQIGNFDGCPSCRDIIQNGGAIKGVVLEDGALRAIVAGYGQLPSESEIDSFSPEVFPPPMTPELLPPNGPYLNVIGSVPVGQATAFIEDTITVYGGNFCADPSCSTIDVKIDNQLFAAGVPVNNKGEFTTNFVLTGLDATGRRVSQRQVTVSQRDANNQLLEATSVLFVVRGRDEIEEPEPGEAPKLLSVSSLNGTTINLCFDETLTESSASNVQNYSVNGGAIPVVSATRRPDGQTVKLTLGGMLVPGLFSVNVTNIQDPRGNIGATGLLGELPPHLLTTVDIGSPVPAGASFSCDSGSVEITTGGTGQFLGAGDAFTLVGRPLIGDFDFRATVVTHLNGALNSMAGLIVRENTNSGAKAFGAFIHPTPNFPSSISAVLRRTQGAKAENVGTTSLQDLAPSLQLRLQRRDHQFTAFTSEDGHNWTAVSEVDTASNPFNANLYVGFAAASGLSNQVVTVDFNNISFEEPAPFTPPALSCPSNVVMSACKPARYNLSVSANCGSNVTITCEPPEGIFLPPGLHSVRCYAVDDCGQQSTCSFNLLVIENEGGPCSALTILRQGTNVVLHWREPAWTLQEADNVAGPWNNIFGGTSPYVIPAVKAQKFYLINSNAPPPQAITPLMVRPDE